MKTLRSGWLGSGPRVKAFEEAFRREVRGPHAVAVNSCSAGLHLSLLILGLKPGDEVITTSLTFCATVNAIVHAGATPVLADVDPTSMNLEPEQVESLITPRTRAVLPVHFAGRPCNLAALCRMRDHFGLEIVEDCAHAVEAEYRGRRVGTFGRLGCFSFYATKSVVTGEGGMVLAERPGDARRLRTLALHGMSKGAWERFTEGGCDTYRVEEAGFKYNMTDLQAALGVHQLKRIHANWKRRRQIWECYQTELADLPLLLPADPEPGTKHAFHLYTVRVDEALTGVRRAGFMRALAAEGVGTGIHYLSIPEHPYYRNTFGWVPEQFPKAMRIGRQTVSLPLSAGMSDSDVGRVIGAVRKAVQRPRRCVARLPRASCRSAVCSG
ncbi:MAG: DegT/DnrJ/EryC1/StrS family aminotransferase [bacterium]